MTVCAAANRSRPPRCQIRYDRRSGRPIPACPCINAHLGAHRRRSAVQRRMLALLSAFVGLLATVMPRWDSTDVCRTPSSRARARSAFVSRWAPSVHRHLDGAQGSGAAHAGGSSCLASVASDSANVLREVPLFGISPADPVTIIISAWPGGVALFAATSRETSVAGTAVLALRLRIATKDTKSTRVFFGASCRTSLDDTKPTKSGGS